MSAKRAPFAKLTRLLPHFLDIAYNTSWNHDAARYNSHKRLINLILSVKDPDEPSVLEMAPRHKSEKTTKKINVQNDGERINA